MSEPNGPEPAPSGGGTPAAPRVRLQVWVNIVLVLALFASCSAANQARNAATTSANGINDLQGVSSSLDPAEISDLCRLLARTAQAQGVDIGQVFADPTQGSLCRTAALEAVGVAPDGGGSGPTDGAATPTPTPSTSP